MGTVLGFGALTLWSAVRSSRHLPLAVLTYFPSRGQGCRRARGAWGRAASHSGQRAALNVRNGRQTLLWARVSQPSLPRSTFSGSGHPGSALGSHNPPAWGPCLPAAAWMPISVLCGGGL